MPRPYQVSSIIVILITCMIINFLYFFIDRPPRRFAQNLEDIAYQAGLPYSRWKSKQISNRTLGFEKIFVVGLPARSDRRDAMQLSASLTDIDIAWVDGVSGKEMATSAVPPALFDPDMRGLMGRAQVGSWRGHMNTIRQIVREGLGSALVLEDDVDWDVNIVAQLQQFANASIELLQKLNSRQHNETTLVCSDSPYGEGWDILWLGHCGGWIPPAEFNQYNSIISSDSTVPPPIAIQDMLNGVRADSGPCAAHAGRDPTHMACKSPRLLPHQRIVQIKSSPICSFAYALSQKGARKALLHLGGSALPDIKASFDTMLTEVCRGEKDVFGGEETKCLTVSPPYFVHHRARGAASGDSDITPLQGDETQGSREIGFTKGVVFSTRLNARNLIEGREAESQYIWIDERIKWRCKHQDEYRGGQNFTSITYKPGLGGL